MTATCLLVPMQLDVMVLTPALDVTTPFLRATMAYENLLEFGNPEPAPFAGGSTTQPAPGAYLHWTVPQSLRHGNQEDDGSTTFPYLPNRWLVTRIELGQPPAQAIKAWLIESDFVDPTAGTSPYLDPSGLDQYGYVQPTKIGRATLLTAVTSLPAQPTPFLQAIGPGSVYFSAYEPGVENVLAFVDTMTMNDDTTPITQPTTFTYAVIGWYSDAEIDPLAGTTWSANTDASLAGTYVNDKHPWYVYAADADLPTQTVVHAMVSTVSWDPSANNGPPPNYPTNTPQTVQVALGSTAIDALAAIVGLNSNQTEADMLAAFQYNLLATFDQPGSPEALDLAIREHWFNASPGGTVYTVVAKEPPGSTALPVAAPPPLTPAEQAALAALNVAQRTLDRQQRVLGSMQSTLAGLWWMYQWQLQNNPPQPAPSAWLANQLPRQIGIGTSPSNPGGTDPTQEPWYAWKVQAQQNLIAQLQGQVGAATTALTALLDASLTLKATNAPQFFAPQDPVVVITGLGRATNLDPSDGLLCRLPSQTVAGLTVGGTAYTAGTLAAQIPVLADPNSLLPSGAQELNVENLFLSPDLLAQAIFGNTSNVAAVTAAIAALPAPPAGGQFPPVSFAAATWVQPWVPLMLDWQVTVLKAPAYVTPPAWSETAWNPVSFATFDQANWQFNGSDFGWVGPTQSQSQAKPPYTFPNFDEADSASMQLVGRTFITPQATFTLANQLDRYVKQHQFRDPSLEALLQNLDTLVDGIAGQDILSQRLSGLLGQLIQHGSDPATAPSGPITSLLGNVAHGIPTPFPDPFAIFGGPTWSFAPLGGTFFVVNQLTVVDAFGRSIDVMLSNHSTAPPAVTSAAEEEYFFPIAGQCLESPTGQPPAPNKGPSTDPTTRMLALLPRAVQGARLGLTLLTNDGSDTDITLAAGANPICGWVVPNHLDRSLALYAPDGSAWGELYLSQHVNGTYVPAWQPDPTNPSAPQSVEAIPNGFVQQLVAALWNRTDNGAALGDLLLAIDQGLWTINPPGDRNDLDLDVLVGRPLAIVRAELALGLNGLAVTSQDWWNIFAVDPTGPPGDGTQPAALAGLDGGIRSYLWPVRLGSQVLRNDGLIGYFADNPTAPSATYDACTVVTLPAELQTDYLQQVGPTTYPQLRFVDDSATTLDPTQQQVVRLTLLVDPRGAVHAFSGLQPVVATSIPTEFVTPALKNMSYVFRAGPLLTTPDAVRVPRPAASQGTWAWFDNVIDTVTSLTPADPNATIPLTAPLVKEGWLKFTPNPSPDQQ